jgi:hypothetical protein
MRGDSRRPGDIPRAPTRAEIARIEEILNRLDPDPAAVCLVPGCLHGRGATSVVRALAPGRAA